MSFDQRWPTANPGVLIGAGFGTVFLLANSAAPVPAAAGGAIKAVGVGCLLAVVWSQIRGTKDVEDRPGFGQPFWWVVAAEVLVGAGGLVGLRLAGAPVEANVAWIALVVGAHFLALARVWRDTGIAVVGGVMATAGAVGLAMVAAGTAVDWVPAVSGVLSGVALLVGSIATSVAARRRRPPIPVPAQGTAPVRR